MNYRTIAITAKLAPLETVLSKEHQDEVLRESTLAYAAGDLYLALKDLLAATENMLNATYGQTIKDRAKMALASARVEG